MNLEQTVNATPVKYLRSNAADFTVLNGALEVTLEVLHYMEDQSDWNVVCGNGAVDSSGGQIEFHCSSNSNFAGWKVIGTGGVHDWAGTLPSPLRTWSVMHGTYNSRRATSAGKYYSNGVYKSGGDTAGQVGAIATTTNNFNVGGDGQMNRAFGGYVGRIIIWTRELTQADILQRIAEPYGFLIDPMDQAYRGFYTPPVVQTFPAGYGEPSGPAQSQYQQLLAR
jgi:hypothetical protein